MVEPGNGQAALEPGRRKEAFKLYCRLNNKAAVARELDLSKTVVYKWSKEDAWDDRLKEVKERLGVFLQFKEELLQDATVRALASDLDVLNQIQGVAIDAFLEFDLKPKTFGEFLKAMDFVLRHKRNILKFVKDKKEGLPVVPPVSALGTDDVQKHLGSGVKPQPDAGSTK